MSILIALAPGERGTSALDLGAVLARSGDERVVVVTVVPTPWPPSPYRVDAEFLALQERAAQEVLEQARARLDDDLAVEYLVRHDRSVPAGLLAVAAQVGAVQVVLGSSASGGYGRVSLGGVADRLLHSSEVPVALAPRGFVARAGTRVRRVTVAFGRSDGDSDLLRTAAGVADRIGATLRVACFAVHPVNVFSGAVPDGADALVAEEWRRLLDRDIARALDGGALATRVETVVGQGDSWSAALTAVAWAEGDVLAIGTSSSAISRFFLGSHASKIVRSSPVPVVLTPR
ncbi:universal stress protein [Microlunatus capsulatus]|uniref:Nucleotide-binding universal stress UspA family protein n=1 Tax=Microlunatus capsulatus TaxID=99117 RepID=A0ABS4Z4J3_9ACTN|nr:universal stress protein [Microlunatus capsulatus]MBP2415710.1 nucleotide-binding universal stress UspA family protein [Microlunatus capsulatus]